MFRGGLGLKSSVMEIFLMGINQTVKLRFKMYALYVFSLVVRKHSLCDDLL